MRSGDQFDTADETGTEGFIASTPRRGGRKSQSQIAEEALTLKETGKATA